MFEMHIENDRQNEIDKFNLLLDETLRRFYTETQCHNISYDILRFKTDFVKGHNTAETRLIKLLAPFSERHHPAPEHVKQYHVLLDEFKRINREFDWCVIDSNPEAKSDFQNISKYETTIKY
jgi:hypothetical protein